MTRKIFALAITVLALFLVGCEHDSTEKTKTTSTTTLTTEKPTRWEDGFTLPKPSIVDSVTPFSIWEGEYPGGTGHRSIYYGDHYRIVEIVDHDAYMEWRAERPIFDDFHEMAVVQLIKRFNISRKEFDKVNQILIDEAKNSSSYTPFEPYNTELIYTFDPIAISNYYRQYDDEGNVVNWRELEPWNELLKPQQE